MFAALIAVGTMLLRLPPAHAGEPVGWLDAFFTATSAVCVTGLITVDTASAYSRFGQTVILALFQLGGLGIMVFGALAAEVLHLRLSFSSQAAWRSAFFGEQARGDLRRAVWRILFITVAFEVAGALLLLVGLRNGPQARGGVFEAVFLSVSAFCNAGFSVFSDSVVGVRDSAVIMATLMSLIVAGGLGYTVLIELSRRIWRRLRRQSGGTVVWSLQSRVVLGVSGLLIAGGAVWLFVGGLTAAERPVGLRAVHALFQSITARTAGFNTVEIGALPLCALLPLILLMFIGGSPGSCAGGIKTTTAAIWSARIWARLVGRDDVALWGRRIPQEVVRRAALVLALAALWNVLGVLVLVITESARSVPFEHLIFEQVSAFATVGLSTGITPTLSPLGKLWIIASMFVGRLGPLTIAMGMLARARMPYRYPTERVMVG